MQIDLNNTNEFTLENVAALIASKDDSCHRQIRVTANGELFLSDEVGADNTSDLAFRLETFSAGGGYTGSEAAKDIEHVRRIYECLNKNWPNPTFSYIDSF